MKKSCNLIHNTSSGHAPGMIKMQKVWLMISLVFLMILPGMVCGQIAQRGTPTSATTTNTTLTINKPSGVVTGDVMIVNISQTGNTGTNASRTGWTLIAGAQQGGTSGTRRSTILYRKADGTEGTSFAFTLGSGTSAAVGSIIAFSGVDASVFDATPGSLSTGGSNTASATGITTSSANAAVIFLAGAGGSSTIYSNWSGTTPSIVEIMDFGGSSVSVGAAWGIRATAGTTGNRTVGLDNNYYWAGMLIALKPFVPPILSSSALTGFGNVCPNTTTGPNSFTITGTNLTTANVTVAALTGYSYSTTSGGTYSTSLNLTHAAGAYSQAIYVKFTPTAVQAYNGNIVVGGGGAGSINVAVTGSGVNSAPTITTPTSTALTTNSATLGGNITDPGCTNVTERGIYWSTVNGFADGTGTKVSVTPGPYTPGAFTIPVTGLSPNTVYYYKAFASNGGGAAYSAQGTFTTACFTVGDPAVFGDYGWNVYAYNGDDIDLGPGITYRGYYSFSSLSFDTRTVTYGYADNGSPSDAPNYQGCSVDADYHTVVHKRKRFDCGTYRIDVNSNDDAIRFYVDGVQVSPATDYGYNTTTRTIWTGPLNSTSEVEIRHEDQEGGSHAAVTFTLISPAVAAVVVSGGGTFCNSTTLTAGNGGDGTIYFQGTTSGGTDTSNPTTSVSITEAGTYYFRARSGVGCWSEEGSATVIITSPEATGVTICAGEASQSLSSSTICPSGGAANTGATDAGTGANVSGIGSTAWTNPNNIATVSTTDYARVTINNGISNYLQGSNYGFSIPTNSTINGIVLTIRKERQSGAGNEYYDQAVNLVKNGTVIGNNKAITTTNWGREGQNPPPVTYGASNDTWGVSWSSDDINAANFGAVISARTPDNIYASVFYMQITVYYTTPSGTLEWYTASSGGTSIGTGSSFNPVGVSGSGLPDTNTAGTYPFWVECSTNPGCRAVAQFVINALPTFTVLPTHISCFNEGDGAIEITPAGGSGAGYQYRWRSRANSSAPWSVWSGWTDITVDFNNLSPADYEIQVQDSNGCIQTECD